MENQFGKGIPVETDEAYSAPWRRGAQLARRILDCIEEMHGIRRSFAEVTNS